jgi:hypothetical protein
MVNAQQISSDVAAGPATRKQNWKKLAGAAGIASAALTVAGIAIIPKSPATGARAVATYFVQHQSALQVSAFLRGAGMLVFLLFVAGLVELLRRNAASTGVLAGAAVAGAVTAAVILASLALWFALAGNAAHLHDPTVAQLVRDMAEDLGAFALFGQIALISLVSWALLAGRKTARVIGRASLVVTALLLAGTASIAVGSRDIADPGWLALTLWTVALSLLMIRDKSAPSAHAANPAPAGDDSYYSQ